MYSYVYTHLFKTSHYENIKCRKFYSVFSIRAFMRHLLAATTKKRLQTLCVNNLFTVSHFPQPEAEYRANINTHIHIYFSMYTEGRSLLDV